MDEDPDEAGVNGWLRIILKKDNKIATSGVENPRKDSLRTPPPLPPPRHLLTYMFRR
jgi:hypothetical protein